MEKKQGRFGIYETKLGEPTTAQIEFTKNIYNEVRYLKRKHEKLLKHKDLDVDEMYSFFKEKYKLVKMEKSEEWTKIVIRFDKSSAVLIARLDTRLLRFYEKDKLFTLAEMLYLYEENKICTARHIGSDGWANYNNI